MSLILVNPHVRVRKTKLKSYRRAYSYRHGGKKVKVKRTRLKRYRKAYKYYYKAANPWKPKAVKAAKWYLGIGAGFAAARIIDLFIHRSKKVSPAPLKLSSIAGLPLPIITWPLNAYNIIRNINQIGVRAIPIIGAFKDEPASPPPVAPQPPIKGIGGNYY